ncbi:MAG TPA: sigma-54-dependent Fis family transcriptional regulator [Chromatiales bacterium]|nr:sigma-54-dependent Fis family transcriptional regulator [Chromatiales bacterium]
MPEILVVEDDQTLNRLICDQLARHGHSVYGSRSLAEMQAYLNAHEPSLVLLDARLPDGNALERIPELAEEYPIVVLTAFASVADAVEAMKAGAVDYLAKPVRMDELLISVDRALSQAALARDHHFCKRQLAARRGAKNGGGLVGHSAVLRRVQETIRAVAPEDITVLIHGESGTGKELVAQSIHQHSPRSERNFVVVDCCTLQKDLFESELFGHEKGAFTGADRQKKGLIEAAEGGTLFLDEIGEIDEAAQAKLLRLLETGQYRRLGGTRMLKADVRIVAATNRDLEAMARTGEFRADLYYRLSAFVLAVPPLRERREDIPVLAEHFLRNHDFSCRVSKQWTQQAIRKLVAYEWPGNVRELRNVVERAIILSRDSRKIRPEHIVFGTREPEHPGAVRLVFEHQPTLEEIEARYLADLLERYSGHRSKVAEVMGVSERSVYRMIRKYGLETLSRPKAASS